MKDNYNFIAFINNLMLTLTVADLDIGEPINFTYISITLLVNSLPHKTLPLTSLPI